MQTSWPVFPSIANPITNYCCGGASERTRENLHFIVLARAESIENIVFTKNAGKLFYFKTIPIRSRTFWPISFKSHKTCIQKICNPKASSTLFPTIERTNTFRMPFFVECPPHKMRLKLVVSWERMADVPLIIRFHCTVCWTHLCFEYNLCFDVLAQYPDFLANRRFHKFRNLIWLARIEDA